MKLLFFHTSALKNKCINRPEVFCKKGVFENFANSQESTSVRVSFLIKFQALGLQLYFKKETLTQAFSGEFYKIFKNTFFIEHIRWLLLIFQVLILRPYPIFCSHW